MIRPIRVLLPIVLLVSMCGLAQATTVTFTTNAVFGTPEPYPVQNVNVYIDGAASPTCTTDATGDCIGPLIDLTEGLYSVRYELLQSSGGPVLGSVTHYVNVPTKERRWPSRSRPCGSAGTRTTASVSA